MRLPLMANFAVFSCAFLFVFLSVESAEDNPVNRNFKCRLNGCCDQHEFCRFWSVMGECAKNRRWMSDNCQLACNTCSRPPTGRAKVTNPPAPPPTRRPVAARPPPARIGAPPVIPANRRPQRPPVRRVNPVAVPRPPPPPAVQPTFQAPAAAAPPPPPPQSAFRFPAPAPPPPPQPTFRPPAPVPPPPPPRNGSPLARCAQIRNDPSLAAEVLLRERLVFPTEDTSGRSMLSADKVIRSNLANACVPRLDQAECERSLCYNLYFRTMDGTCNNFAHPLRGAAYRPYNRLLAPEYDNGLSEPASSIRVVRPNPREANRALLSSPKSVLSQEFNALLMQFGQFMSHDMAKTTLVPSAKCNVCQNIPGRCMAVFITSKDPNKNFKKDTCIRVSRSSAICGSGRTKPRQQLNENTGYIDGSPIYGSSIEDMPKFREGQTPFLKLKMFNGFRVLPFDQAKCKGPQACTATFVAGDSRVNLFLGLTTFHLLFTREHNRIAARLQRLNPHWSGDRIFQEARKIVGGQIQAICYREYLPKILGSAFATTVGTYRGYDPNIDSTVANEFTAGAFRFGHGMIQEFYPKIGPNNQSMGGFNFVDGTLHSDKLIFGGGTDPILRGFMKTPIKRPQRLTPSITEQMFGSTDLGTINIQRGRDHGLPPYIRLRRLCGLSTPRTFDDLSGEILSENARAALRRLYSSPENIDFYVGALLEDPVVRGLVGPTVACIVGAQFGRTRDGDRFYFENPGIFTRAQLAEIRRSSLARVICDNGDNIRFVPREAFRLGPMVDCSEIPSMDLSKWKE
uniref:ShKT domain-containing protein n=1 Tax=Panagrolaimus sp. JU765 TaxID=591449 RepID=A0AC34R5A6_9BILA